MIGTTEVKLDSGDLRVTVGENHGIGFSTIKTFEGPDHAEVRWDAAVFAFEETTGYRMTNPSQIAGIVAGVTARGIPQPDTRKELT